VEKRIRFGLLRGLGRTGKWTKRAPRRDQARQPRVETLESRQLLAYTGPSIYAIAYSPTWPHWEAKKGTQLFDSDFATASFQKLWGTVNGQGRNDLKTIADSGFNTIRLYNWSPSRQGRLSNGEPDGKLDGHTPFLNYAASLGLKVIVPVSNYFLGDDQYSWRGQRPNANFSFDHAPEDIRTDLNQFIENVTVNYGTPSVALNPAVRSIAIGNEMDLGGLDGDPKATVKLERAEWWVVNLEQKLTGLGITLPPDFFSIPISNADQSNYWYSGKSTGGNTSTTIVDNNFDAHPPWGHNIFTGLTLTITGGTDKGETRTIVSNTSDSITVSEPFSVTPDTTTEFGVGNPSPVSWFNVFANGATGGERVPTGTRPDGPAGRFTANVKGLGSYSWYNTEFYNSLNTFQTGDHLANTLTQYSTGTPTASDWDGTWPGYKPTVPILLTELGTSRLISKSGTEQAATILQKQAQIAENQMLSPTNNVMGYTVFEFNDEPEKNGHGEADNEKFFGIEQYNTNIDQFRNGRILYNANTGKTKWAGGYLDPLTYPVYELFPVYAANGQTVLSELKTIFGQKP
jgi:hypothetical protein